MKVLLIITFFFAVTFSNAQEIDTLLIKSEAFNSTRVVYVLTPKLYKYKSKDVKLPVFYILDGQNEWFINPFLNTVKYLQYTHEIPQAIVVVIPLKNRNKECRVRDIQNDSAPLLKFISSELPTEIEKYDPNGLNVLVGHSMTASFALYSYLRKPNFYSAVFANTPMYLLEEIMSYLKSHEEINRGNIYISVGGIKDKYHLENYNKVKTLNPNLFLEINTFEANFSTHTAVPIVANPTFLSQLFVNFSTRFNEIAKVDFNYKLLELPESVNDELSKINQVISNDNFQLSMEIPTINGIVSRYLNSDLNEYAIAMYFKGVQLYPNFYYFHLSLGKLLMKENDKRAKEHLTMAIHLIDKYESDLQGKDEIKKDIEDLLSKLVE